jgi:hypothetical protein
MASYVAIVTLTTIFQSKNFILDRNTICANVRSVVHLFSSKGFTTLINDNLLGNILTLGHVVVGLLSMFFAYLNCLIVNLGPHSNETYLTCGGLFTYLMCLATLNFISSATSTVYVCFVDNSICPCRLDNHPPCDSQLLSVSFVLCLSVSVSVSVSTFLPLLSPRPITLSTMSSC